MIIESFIVESKKLEKLLYKRDRLRNIIYEINKNRDPICIECGNYGYIIEKEAGKTTIVSILRDEEKDIDRELQEMFVKIKEELKE